jgi:hypothetical protein
MNEVMTEALPTVRCSRAMKRALLRIAKRSVAKNVTDHIRYAIERYIAEQGEALIVNDDEEVMEGELIGK